MPLTKQGRGVKCPGLVIFALSFLVLACAGTPPGPGQSVASLPAWSVVDADAEFTEQLRKALALIEIKKSGKALFSAIASAQKPVRFRRNMLSTGLCTGLDDKPVVWWNPSFGVPETPAHLMVYHELMHALQRLQLRADGGDWMEQEAIGLGAFAQAEISENAFRRESGLPARTTHDELPGISEDELIKHSQGKFQPDWEWNDKERGWQPRKIEVILPAWVELE